MQEVLNLSYGCASCVKCCSNFFLRKFKCMIFCFYPLPENTSGSTMLAFFIIGNVFVKRATRNTAMVHSSPYFAIPPNFPPAKRNGSDVEEHRMGFSVTQVWSKKISLVRLLRGHTAAINYTAFLSNKIHAFSCSDDMTAKVCCVFPIYVAKVGHLSLFSGQLLVCAVVILWGSVSAVQTICHLW